MPSCCKERAWKAEDNPSILRVDRLYFGDARNSLGHLLEYLLELFRMLLIHVLGYQGNVITEYREVLSVAGFLAAASLADVKIGYVPIFDQAAKGAYLAEALELSQALNRENVWRF